MKLTKFMIGLYSVLTVLAFLSIFYASSTPLSAACSVVITGLLAFRLVLLVKELKEERNLK
jgi:hypothetical protein